MIRRINYTGRQRLNRDDVKIVLHEDIGKPAKFDAIFRFQPHDLPDDATVFVEAYRQTFLMRFDFGTVSKLEAPSNRSLTEFETPDGLLFRIKITSQSPQRGRLLAEADRIPFRRADEVEQDRVPLLPVVPQDLGAEITRVDFADEPRLLINSTLGDFRSLARSPVFMSLVYPQAFREILTRILRIDNYREVDDPNNWRSNWLRYSMMLPGIAAPPEEDDETLTENWIDDVVSAFCKKTEMLERFRSYWTKEQAE
jgi:hypothetical protein